jgi:small subunit ribosomal protein S2
MREIEVSKILEKERKSMEQITMPSLLEMLKSGVHFGHQKSRWHPKMKPFIFTQRNDVHIVDLEKTQNQLTKATQFIIQITSEGGEVLFVGSKKQVRDIILKAATRAQSPYVIEKWVGGTFTNFNTILKLIRKLEKLEKQREKGDWSKYTKKEQLELTKQYDNLNKKVGGIRQMIKLPGVMFVIDIKEEKTAVTEARKKGIAIVALCDTNVDPSKVNIPIPGNDDAVKSVELITNTITEAVILGKKEFASKQAKSQSEESKTEK